METTVDRINVLLTALHMPTIRHLYLQPNRMEGEETPILYRSMTPGHDLLDTIDSHVGIITRYQFKSANPAPLGERLRRLERHIDAQETPPFFWLGADAEQSIGAAPA